MKIHPYPPHVLRCWPKVVERIHAAKHLVLFLDFDGTLTPLRRRSQDVRPLALPVRKLLRRIACRRQVTVYIISGRSLVDLRKLARVPGVRLLGMHGWEGREVPPMDKARQHVRGAWALLQKRLPKSTGIRVENKGLGLAVNYRSAAKDTVPCARRIVLEVLDTYKPDLYLLEGKKLWELLPREIDGKGPAVHNLLSTFPESTLPVFVGDDTSDESAFGVLRQGLTIHVGAKRRTKARFRLRDPEEVRLFLLRLESTLP